MQPGGYEGGGHSGHHPATSRRRFAALLQGGVVAFGVLFFVGGGLFWYEGYRAQAAEGERIRVAAREAAERELQARRSQEQSRVESKRAASDALARTALLAAQKLRTKLAVSMTLGEYRQAVGDTMAEIGVYLRSPDSQLQSEHFNDGIRRAGNYYVAALRVRELALKNGGPTVPNFQSYRNPILHDLQEVLPPDRPLKEFQNNEGDVDLEQVQQTLWAASGWALDKAERYQPAR